MSVSLSHYKRYIILWYAGTVFVGSACLMILEIAAGRLLAPYIGVSLYTWTSIIGVILAGLSLGNYLGGVWADRGGNNASVGIALGLAGLSSFMILLMLTFIAPWMQASSLSLLSASFFYVVCLFFIPSVLLGIVTPLLTTLALSMDDRTGHIVGRLQAFAALGSIFGTFLSGFVLVQTFGTQKIIIGTGVVLLVLASPYILNSAKKSYLAIILITVAVVAATAGKHGFVSPCERESNYFCIRVVDESFRAPFGEARTMVLDHLIHGISHKSEPGMLIPSYMHLMDELVMLNFQNNTGDALKFFFAGGGSYTQPRAVQSLYPGAEITVSELDPMVTQVAVDKLYLNIDNINVLHQDARLALNLFEDEYFDVIVGDVFHDVSIPYHLVTLEYANIIKRKLKQNGIYTLNVVDVFPDPLLVKSVYKTLMKSFQYVDVWLEELPQGQERVTFVLSATNTVEPPDVIRAARGFERTWVRITEPMQKSGTPMSSLPILTDDFVPVERLIAPLITTSLGE